MLPNSVTVPDADADPLPDPLADTEGAPSLPQAASNPATPITLIKRTTQNEVLMWYSWLKQTVVMTCGFKSH
jgi:hypothetical protein